MATDSSSAAMLQFTVEKSLGESLNLVRNKAGQLRVIKQYKVSSVPVDGVKAKLMSLVELTKHSCMVDIDTTYTVGDTICIVTAYCEGGSLGALIKRARHYDEILNEIEVVDWLVQILLALQHLHSRGIVYGQLNPKNILLFGNCARLSIAKLLFREMDIFGKTLSETSSEFVSDHACYQNQTPYLSPELISSCSSSKLPTAEDDIWALGCVLYEMCARRKLFPRRKNPKEGAAVQTDCNTVSNFPPAFSREVAELWLRMMERDPKKRPSASKLLEIEYLNHHRTTMDDCQQSVCHSNIDTSNYFPDRNPVSAEAGLSCGATASENYDSYGSEDDDTVLTADDIQELLQSL